VVLLFLGLSLLIVVPEIFVRFFSPPTLALIPQPPSLAIDIGALNPTMRLFRWGADELWVVLLRSHPSPSPKVIVMEVGGFDGSQSIYAAVQNFSVFTIEASPPCYSKIKDLQEKYPLAVTNMKLFNLAASNETKTVEMWVSPWCSTEDHVGRLNPAEKGYNKDEHKKNVQATTLDSFSLQHGLSFIYILKIDVQGHEFNVLQGFEGYIKDHRILIILLEFWPNGINATTGNDPSQIFRFLHSHGYSLFDLPIAGRLFAPTLLDQYTRPTGFKENVDFFFLTTQKRQKMNLGGGPMF